MSRGVLVVEVFFFLWTYGEFQMTWWFVVVLVEADKFVDVVCHEHWLVIYSDDVCFQEFPFCLAKLLALERLAYLGDKQSVHLLALHI